MSSILEFAGHSVWGSNGQIEAYVERLLDQSRLQCGEHSPFALYFRDLCEQFPFMGTRVPLGELLNGPNRCAQFVLVAEAASAALAEEASAHWLHGTHWLDVEIAGLIAHVRAAADAGSASSSVRRRCLAAEAIETVLKHPLRQQLPLEAVLSLPIPLAATGPHLVFFWASQGGPAGNRRYSGPYCRTDVDLSNPGSAVFSFAASPFSSIPSAASLPTTVGRSFTAADRKAALGEFSDLTDTVAELFETGNSGADLSTIERSTLRSYEALFHALAVVALLPAYRELNPSFFEWLEAATGSDR